MWAEAQASWRDLEGRTVTGWRGVEMALHGGADGEGPAVFDDPRIPFRQLWALDLLLADGPACNAGTYQQDTDFGLVVRDGSRHDTHGWQGGYRACEPALPTGRVDRVETVEEQDVVAEVVLTVGGTPLLLIAGEVEPTWSGGLDVVRYDESVLVFADPADADEVTWRPPRPSRSRGR